MDPGGRIRICVERVRSDGMNRPVQTGGTRLCREQGDYVLIPQADSRALQIAGLEGDLDLCGAGTAGF